MVNLVLVSHSRALAEALVPFIREMAGDEVNIAVAAGAGDDTAFGTDATAIRDAILDVDSDDGVLILGDVGSALLSTDLALELLPDDVRSRTRLVPAPFVEGALAAAVQASMGSDLDAVAAEATRAINHKQRSDGSTPAVPEAPDPPAGDASAVEIELTNPHGLHARPAAQLVRVAAAHDADVHVENLSRGAGPVSAASISAVSTLGASQGHRLRLTARGPEAEAALTALQALAENQFATEPPAASPSDAPPSPDERSSPEPSSADGSLVGVPIHPGTALGPAARLDLEVPSLPSAPSSDPEEAWATFEAARATVRAQLEGDQTEGDAAHRDILDAHLLLLDDPELLEETHRRIVQENTPPARAWHDAVRRLAEQYAAMDDAYLSERADDVRDVGRRVLLELLGDREALFTLPDAPCVLVAEALPPSIVPRLKTDRVRGFVCAAGSATAHAAILLRDQGIPAVFGVGTAATAIDPGTTVGLDGSTGRVWIAPSPPVVERLEAQQHQEAEQAATHQAAAHAPAAMDAGPTIQVDANVGRLADAEAAARNGADGVGLLRTEFVFDGDAAPTADEQVAALQRIAGALEDRPITVRALDAGGDKPLPYLSMPAERNPFLGLRGIRLLLRHPDLFQTQLQALLRVARRHPLQLMLPMVTTVDEVRQTRSLLETARTQLQSAGLDHAPTLPLGIMVETPACALAADRFVPHVDFFSIGTNDLTQYVMATDREHAPLADLSDPLVPPVLRLVRRVTDAADGSPVSVCGEAAADPLAVPLFLGLGVRHLSVRPQAVPRIKALVRTLSMDAVEFLAEAALEADDADAVRARSRTLVGDDFLPQQQTG